VKFIEENQLNEVFDGDETNVGLIMQGGMYNTALRALELLGLADSFGNSQVPIYVLNVTYPLIPSEVERFCKSKQAVMLIEEGQPDYIEQAINTLLRKASIRAAVYGKDVLPMAGEYTGEVMMQGLRNFFERVAPHLLKPGQDAGRALQELRAHPAAQALPQAVPVRPPGFCTGCPERPIFTAMKMVENEVGPMHVSADIGCHLFSINEPFNIGQTTMGYGLGAAGASAFNVASDKPAVSVMGDGGFWHNGLTSGIGNAVVDKTSCPRAQPIRPAPPTTRSAKP